MNYKLSKTYRYLVRVKKVMRVHRKAALEPYPIVEDERSATSSVRIASTTTTSWIFTQIMCQLGHDIG